MGGDAASVLALYPPDQFATGLARLQALLSDTGFICPTLDFATVAPDTFVYHYTYVSASNPFGLGATHGAELVLLFAHPEGIRGIGTEFDAVTATVSDAIQQTWVDFATTGDPGWATFGDSGEIMLLDDPLETTTEIRDGRCAALGALTS
jgi:para-nitrobenzyl esterase